MSYQQNFGMNNGFMPYGANPTQSVASGVKVNSWLTPEKINSLRKNHDQWSFSVTQEEVDRAVCNHRNENGTPSLILNEDGSYTCSICGHTFSTTEEYSASQVEEATRMITNILQTTKLLYISLDPQIGKDFYQVLAFIQKIPHLYKIASDDYKKYEGVYGFTSDIPQNAFAIFGAMTNPNIPFGGYGYAPQYTGQPAPQMMGGLGMMGGAQQQMYAPMGQPQMPGTQPMGMQQPMQSMYGQPMVAPQAVGGNPFYQTGYVQPQVAPNVNAYTGQPQGFAMNPQGAAAPAQQTATAAPEAPKADGAVAVDANFKG